MHCIVMDNCSLSKSMEIKFYPVFKQLGFSTNFDEEHYLSEKEDFYRLFNLDIALKH